MAPSPPRLLLPTLHDFPELDDFQGAIVPVVTPADDDVSALDGMKVVKEIAAFILKLNTDAAEPARGDFPQGLTVREAGLDTQHREAETLSQSAEEKEHAIFISGREGKRGEAERSAIGGRLNGGPGTRAQRHGFFGPGGGWLRGREMLLDDADNVFPFTSEPFFTDILKHARGDGAPDAAAADERTDAVGALQVILADGGNMAESAHERSPVKKEPSHTGRDAGSPVLKAGSSERVAITAKFGLDGAFVDERILDVFLQLRKTGDFAGASDVVLDGCDDFSFGDLFGPGHEGS